MMHINQIVNLYESPIFGLENWRAHCDNGDHNIGDYGDKGRLEGFWVDSNSIECRVKMQFKPIVGEEIYLHIGKLHMTHVLTFDDVNLGDNSFTLTIKTEAIVDEALYYARTHKPLLVEVKMRNVVRENKERLEESKRRLAVVA